MKVQYNEAAGRQYFDFESIARRGYAFNFIIGGRGIGKTYGGFKYCQQHDLPFVYLRSGDPEYEMASSPETSPIRAHWQPLVIKKSRGAAAVYDAELAEVEGKEKLIPLGLIGYTASLSTFRNMRGAELHRHFEQGGICIYDEFVRERSAKRILRDEFDAFYNFYETAFRETPVQTFFFSNSVDLNSPILARLDLIRPAEYMLIHHMDTWTDESRSILIHMPHDIPITEVKRKTALNVLAAGTAAAASALDNDFSYLDMHDIKREDLRMYKPLASVETDTGLVTMWLHKSDRRVYFSRTRASCEVLSSMLFRAAWQNLYKVCLASNKIRFDDYHLKLEVQELLD